MARIRRDEHYSTPSASAGDPAEADAAPSYSRVFFGFERVLSVQRPVGLAHSRGIRRRTPTPRRHESSRFLSGGTRRQ